MWSAQHGGLSAETQVNGTCLPESTRNTHNIQQSCGYYQYAETGVLNGNLNVLIRDVQMTEQGTTSVSQDPSDSQLMEDMVEPQGLEWNQLKCERHSRTSDQLFKSLSHMYNVLTQLLTLRCIVSTVHCSELKTIQTFMTNS